MLSIFILLLLSCASYAWTWPWEASPTPSAPPSSVVASPYQPLDLRTAYNIPNAGFILATVRWNPRATPDYSRTSLLTVTRCEADAPCHVLMEGGDIITVEVIVPTDLPRPRRVFEQRAAAGE